jgi:hypothetical protein
MNAGLPHSQSCGPSLPRAAVWAAAAIGVLIVGLLLYHHRPEGQFFYPQCTFHQATGLLCPGCGGLRASHALLHGRLAEAARCNLLLVAGLPIVGAVWMVNRRRAGRDGNRAGWSPGVRTFWWAFGVCAAFTILRNLPGGPGAWLSP